MGPVDGLLVGRFQPFHLGHLEALRFALGRVSRLWVGIGSSNAPVSEENPFTAAQRAEMISSSVGRMAPRIRTYEIPDAGDHGAWARQIDEIVPPFGVVFTNDGETGRLYSGRARVVRIPMVRRRDLSGTRVRALIRSGGAWEGLVPPGTRGVVAGATGRRAGP
ncbi:MAG: adenylyltransferase/cytidyltransferase family protein [Nitrosopumilus sp.]|nr:adenylyltransferase/cytidyltransferase family protein [Nitrosopumilus sp.]CAI9830672.1 Nicotinamide-nucleotide adenylyltransferase [Nitrosopumilaceae archaeon]MDA7941149.1 adenylyltransferase/cytidyltransferase family protein [Nitrosopumilus sp.]MDA7942453.1 adenylyltransferase/cytidyltransferase family protein [Nitrosopumilus sp.]MDA7945501.1 adenylyltransferase/cytidyltransferase family protein [Nitrosopumilus sp.]